MRHAPSTTCDGACPSELGKRNEKLVRERVCEGSLHVLFPFYGVVPLLCVEYVVREDAATWTGKACD